MPIKTRVVFSKGHLEITKTSSRGRKQGITYTISNRKANNSYRHLDLTVDDLFDITDALDDICDEIEDKEKQASLIFGSISREENNGYNERRS